MHTENDLREHSLTDVHDNEMLRTMEDPPSKSLSDWAVFLYANLSDILFSSWTSMVPYRHLGRLLKLSFHSLINNAAAESNLGGKTVKKGAVTNYCKHNLRVQSVCFVKIFEFTLQ